MTSEGSAPASTAGTPRLRRFAHATGAKPDVFFTADLDWMDYAANRNLIRAKTRANLLTNRLVRIAPLDSSVQLEVAPVFELAAALGDGRLSMGDPDSVPAGKYARSALMSLGVWNQVADRLVRADNVRAALAFVGRGEGPLGIVYETDARVDKNVRVLGTFPEDSHPPIVYPAAADPRLSGTGSTRRPEHRAHRALPGRARVVADPGSAGHHVPGNAARATQSHRAAASS